MEQLKNSEQYEALLGDENVRKQFLEIAEISMKEGLPREAVRLQLLDSAGGLMDRFCDLQNVKPLTDADDETYSSLVDYAKLIEAAIKNLVIEHEYEH